MIDVLSIGSTFQWHFNWNYAHEIDSAKHAMKYDQFVITFINDSNLQIVSRISAGKIGDELIAWFRSARVNLRRVDW